MPQAMAVMEQAVVVHGRAGVTTVVFQRKKERTKMRGRQLLRVLLPLAVLVGLILAPMAASAEDAVVADGEWTTVVGARLGLRVRSGPSLSDGITFVLYNGNEVKVVGEPTWYQGIRWVEVDFVRWDDVHVSGWVASAYLDNYPGYDEPQDGYEGTAGYKVTSSIGLRLREGPGLGYWVAKIVPYGTVLERTETAGVTHNGLHWVELDVDGVGYWAASEYLQEVPGS